MNDNVLILPDGGPDFLKTVRLAALYSEKVHVFAPTNERTIDNLTNTVVRALPHPGRVNPIVLQELRAIDPQLAATLELDAIRRSPAVYEDDGNSPDHPARLYLRTCVANQKELSQLESEGALRSVIEQLFPADAVNSAENLKRFVEGMHEAIVLAKPFKKSAISESFSEAACKSSPTICSLVDVAFEFVGRALEDPGALGQEDSRRRAATAFYFVTAGYYASLNDCAGATADEAAQAYFDDFRLTIARSDGFNAKEFPKRDKIRRLLGERILLDQVPDVSTLPIEDIINIRRKREPELKAFRDQLSAMAAQIDPNLEGYDLALAVNDKIQTDVKPALNDVRRSIRELQIKAYKKLLHPADRLTTTMITFGISYLSGAASPAEWAAAAAGISKLFDFTAGKSLDLKVAKSSSPYSLLFYLNER